MSRRDETEVLVVGAGPVGMFTALLLAEEGIEVTLIDEEYRTAAHSYACVLHPATLRLLDRLGLAEEISMLGRPIESAAFYDGDSRRAEIKFSQLDGAFPYALVLPQSAFEEVLELRLLSRSRIRVLWNHRLSDLDFNEKTVVASMDKLAQTGKGYIVADSDWTVEKRLEMKAAFVVGADGHESTVRSRLGIDYEQFGGPEHFAVFEFETDPAPANEMRVVIDDRTTNVLWPLGRDRWRWTFQLVKATDPGEFPPKDREHVRFFRPDDDERMRHALERLVRQRAPWFKRAIKDLQWTARVRFEHRLAKQFGRGGSWLVGDSAHQTGPIGAQSMNAGLLEAADLSDTLKKILLEGAPRRLLDEYGRVHRFHWEQLLGKTGGLEAAASADPWVALRRDRIIPCVLGSGEDLAPLIGQLGLEFEASKMAS